MRRANQVSGTIEVFTPGGVVFASSGLSHPTNLATIPGPSIGTGFTLGLGALAAVRRPVNQLPYRILQASLKSSRGALG